jgi:hypothetical protein
MNYDICFPFCLFIKLCDLFIAVFDFFQREQVEREVMLSVFLNPVFLLPVFLLLVVQVHSAI